MKNFRRALAATSSRCLATLIVASPAYAANRPNIILIESDDQRQDAVGAYGDPTVLTPALDSLVREGTTLTNVRNQGSYNAAVCVASRAMVMSGRSLWHYDDNLRGEITLGETLRNAGYYTYGTGKWHNGDAALVRSFTDADNITPGFLPKGHDSTFATEAVHDGKIRRGANVSREHSTDLIGDTAIAFIRDYKGEKPFFLYFGFNAPHDPYTRIPAFEKLYRDVAGVSTVKAPPAFAPRPAFDIGTLGIRDEKLLPRPLVPAALAEQNAIYHAMISHLDDRVGKLLATLKARGLDKDTIVVFTSDHGLARGSNGLLGKQNVYEHTLKIPFIVRGPGIPAGRKDDAPLYNYELYRTIADFAGATPSENSEGSSFRAILENTGGVRREDTYHGYTSLMRALVEGRWKLAEYHVGKVRHTQLFDLTTDPLEEKSLADDPAQKERIDGLRRRMVEERDRYGDRDATFWNDIGFGTPVAPSKKKPGKADEHTAREEE